MRTCAVLNPKAGLAAQRALAAVQRSAAFGGATVKVTTGPGDARMLAAEAVAAGYEAVLSLGGDGTANEVASALVGTATALGVVPVGSGNGLARTLGISLNPDAALAALGDGLVRPMDVGTVNGRLFLNVAGAGFDAVVGAEFQEHGRRGGRRGVFTYVRLGLRRSLAYRAEHWTLEAGGTTFTGAALVVAFVNGRQYGGGAVIAPGAQLDDGLLDIVLIEDMPRLEMVWNAQRMFFGNIKGFKRYRHVAAASAVLTGTGPVVHHRDGEPETAAGPRLEVAVQPLALQILVPRPTAVDPLGPFGNMSRS